MRLTIRKVHRECGPPVYQLTSWSSGSSCYIGHVVDEFHSLKDAEKTLNQMVYSERRRLLIDKENRSEPYLMEVTI